MPAWPRKSPSTPAVTTAAGGGGGGGGNGNGNGGGGGGAPRDCDFCGRVGLPILPLRYAVVPSYLPEAGMVAPQKHELGTGIVDKALVGHRYVLRTLRSGYVMVYLGHGLWNAYVVCEQGYLRKLADLDDADHRVVGVPEACARDGRNIPASFITVDAIPVDGRRCLPETIWAAFSTTLWTRAVRLDHQEGMLRDERMQAFRVAGLSQHADGMVDAFQLWPDDRTTKLLNELVYEYSIDQHFDRYYYRVTDLKDSTKTWLDEWTASAHPVSPREKESAGVARFAQSVAASSNGFHLPSAIVLRDYAGIVAETNASRLHSLTQKDELFRRGDNLRRWTASEMIVAARRIWSQAQHDLLVREDLTLDVILPGRDLRKEAERLLQSLPPPLRLPTAEEVRRQKVENSLKRLEKHYKEAERAAFADMIAKALAEHDKWLHRSDADYATWYGDERWELIAGDYDPAVAEEHGRLVAEYAGLVDGGAMGDASADVWKRHELRTPETGSWPPIFTALFGTQKTLIEALFPEGFPFDEHGKLNKGNKIYKVLKTTLFSKDLQNKLGFGLPENYTIDSKFASTQANPARAWFTKLKAGLFKAIAALSTWISGPFYDRVSRGFRVAAAQLVQAARKLYFNVSLHFFSLEMEVGRYADLMRKAAASYASRGPMVDDLANASRRSLYAGPPRLRSGVAGRRTITIQLWAEELFGEIDVLLLHLEETELARLRPARWSLNPDTLSWLSAQGGKAGRFVKSGSAMTSIFGFFLGCWSLRDNIDKANAAFGHNTEARLAVAGSSLGLVGSIASDVIGNWISLVEKKTATFDAKLIGARWQRVGGIISSVSAVFESMQAFAAAKRTASHGDDDAAALWAISGGLTMASAVMSTWGVATGSAVLGPTGVGLVLMVFAVLFQLAAVDAEDKPIEIWLDRCVWGIHDTGYPRFASMADELAELRAILCGVTVEVAFDRQTEYLSTSQGTLPVGSNESLAARILLPNFDPEYSAAVWRLVAFDTARRGLVLFSGQLGMDKKLIGETLPVPFRSAPSRDIGTKPPQTTKHTLIKHSEKDAAGVLRIDMALGSVDGEASVELAVVYFPDLRNEPDYRASVRVSNEP